MFPVRLRNKGFKYPVFKNTLSIQKEDVIEQAVLPVLELSLDEDERLCQTSEPSNLVQTHSDLVDIKYFIVLKLIEICEICIHESNILKIINILEKVNSKQIGPPSEPSK